MAWDLHEWFLYRESLRVQSISPGRISRDETRLAQFDCHNLTVQATAGRRYFGFLAFSWIKRCQPQQSLPYLSYAVSTIRGRPDRNTPSRCRTCPLLSQRSRCIYRHFCGARYSWVLSLAWRTPSHFDPCSVSLSAHIYYRSLNRNTQIISLNLLVRRPALRVLE